MSSTQYNYVEANNYFSFNLSIAYNKITVKVLILHNVIFVLQIKALAPTLFHRVYGEQIHLGSKCGA